MSFFGHRCYESVRSGISNITFYKHIASPSTTDNLQKYLQNLQSLQARSPYRAIKPDSSPLENIQSEFPCLTQPALRRLLRPLHQPVMNGEVLPSYLSLGNKQVHELTLQNAKDTVLYYLDDPNRGGRGHIKSEPTLGQDLEALLCTLTGVSSLADIHRDGNGKVDLSDWVFRHRAWLNERMNRTDKFCQDTRAYIRSMAAKYYKEQRARSMPGASSSSTGSTVVSPVIISRTAAVSKDVVKSEDKRDAEDDEEVQIISWNYVAKTTAFPLSKNFSAPKLTDAEIPSTNKGKETVKEPEKTIENMLAATTSSSNNIKASTTLAQPQVTGPEDIRELTLQIHSLLNEGVGTPATLQTTEYTTESNKICTGQEILSDDEYEPIYISDSEPMDISESEPMDISDSEPEYEPEYEPVFEPEAEHHESEPEYEPEYEPRFEPEVLQTKVSPTNSQTIVEISEDEHVQMDASSSASSDTSEFEVSGGVFSDTHNL